MGRLADYIDRATTVARSWLNFPDTGNAGYFAQGPFASIWVAPAPNTSAQVLVTERTAVAIGALYSGIGLYADTISTLPVKHLVGREEQPLPQFVRSPAGLSVGWADEIGQSLWSLLLRGNAYLIPTSLDSAGFPATFYVADPGCVQVLRYRGGRVYQVTNYYDDGTKTEQEFTNPVPDELLHITWQRPPGQIKGIGILDAQGGACGVLAGAIGAERYAADVMQNPNPPAVLEHPLRLNKTQSEAMQNQWVNATGRGRAVPAVLSGGIKYTPIQVTPQDVQLIETMRWNATAIAALMHLPPWKVGGSRAESMTYSTVEGDQIAAWTDAYQPACVRLEKAIGGAWTPLGHRLKFVPDAILRSTTLDRYQAHTLALNGKWQTADEIRDLEDEPPLTGSQTKELNPPPPPQLAIPQAPEPPALPSGQ